MATVIRKKKDKKKVDEFLSTSERIFLYISDNLLKLSMALAVLVVSFLAFTYANISKQGNRELMFLDISKIERTITDANRESAIKELEGIVKKFEGVEGVVYAKHLLARQYVFAGHAEKGEPIFKDIKGRYPSSLFSQLAVLDLGLSLESAGKCDSAVAQFQSIIGGQAVFSQPDAYLGLGRCQEQLGKKPEALKEYKEFIQKFPGHPSVEFAKIQVRALES
ncbi:MAG: tetratricopeptide repeat protein [Nitrospinae bacterium]|nr:tetratricopeptide repeat protein [Nitrospinota bacterium]